MTPWKEERVLLPPDMVESAIESCGKTANIWGRNGQTANMIRPFAQDHNKVLYDFADIESYDHDGNYYPLTTDAFAWCSDWCDSRPEDCEDLSSCSHYPPLHQCPEAGHPF